MKFLGWRPAMANSKVTDNNIVGIFTFIAVAELRKFDQAVNPLCISRRASDINTTAWRCLSRNSQVRMPDLNTPFEFNGAVHTENTNTWPARLDTGPQTPKARIIK